MQFPAFNSFSKTFFTALPGFILLFNSTAQADGTISGQIRDFTTKAPIPFAEIFISGCASGNALEDGAYIIDCPPSNEYQMEIQAEGYIGQRIGPLTIRDNAFVQENIMLERLEVTTSQPAQQNNAETASQQKAEKMDAQPSETTLYFSKVLGAIAADRIKRNHEGKQLKRQQAKIQRERTKVQQQEYEAYCRDLLARNDPREIFDSGCADNRQVDICSTLDENSTLAEIRDTGCYDCDVILESNNQHNIRYFRCGTTPSASRPNPGAATPMAQNPTRNIP